MSENKESKFYNQNLLQISDQSVSTNNFKVEQFFSSDQWGNSPAKLKIGIHNYKSKISDTIILDFQTVCHFLMICKSFINMISENKKKIDKDNSIQETISINLRKKVFITLLNRTEYFGTCIRLIISDKNDNFLDSEKVYFSIHDFIAIMKIMTLFRDSYFSIVNSINTTVFLSNISDRIEILENKLNAYYSEYASRNYNQKIDVTSSSDNIIDEKMIVTKENLFSDDNLQNGLDTYLDKEMDNIKLCVTTDSLVEHDQNKKETSILHKSFTKDVLNNNLVNLESLIINSNNDILPFNKISEFLVKKLDIDLFDEISEVDKNCLNYLISCYTKFQLKQNIEKKQKLPQSTSPIIIENIKLNDIKLSLIYDIFIYMIYLTQIRNGLSEKDFNSLKNKDLFTFILKSIFSPLVFSYLIQIEEKPLISEIGRRYIQYRKDNVFSEFEDQIKLNFSFIPDVSCEYIQKEAERIIKALKENYKKCTIENTFEKYQKISCIILSCEDFRKNSFSIEQIKKIISLDLSLQKNEKIEFDSIKIKDFSDISKDILNKYGVSEIKYSNENLKRFVKDNCKDSEKDLEYCLSLANQINESYYDIDWEKIDYQKISEKVLKSFYLWDLKNDKKISMNYNYFCELIELSSLEKDMLISILIKRDDRKEDDFISSFNASKEEL